MMRWGKSEWFRASDAAQNACDTDNASSAAQNACGVTQSKRMHLPDMMRWGKNLMRRAALAIALVALCVLALTACTGKAPTDEASNVTDNQAVNPMDNLVNTAQLPDSSFIYDASIADLEQADSYMDGQTVQITGEVIGDRITSEFDNEYCWITMQATDTSDAQMSVYMPITATRIIDTYGAYSHRGTTLQVRGTFNLACADHDGLTDIHSTNVSLVRRGIVSHPEFDIGRFAPGIFLVALGIGLIFLYRLMSERRR